MKSTQIIKRLYEDYSKKFLNKILFAAFFSIMVAASTSAIAWLLDPAIKKIFIDKDETLIFLIPAFIIITFATKGVSLYLAKSTMIKVGEEIKKILQFDMVSSLINADTKLIDGKHSGKFISNLTFDVTHITNMLSDAILALFKENIVNSVDHRVKEIEKQIEQEMYEGEGSGIDNDEQTWNWTPSSWKRVLPLQY